MCNDDNQRFGSRLSSKALERPDFLFQSLKFYVSGGFVVISRFYDGCPKVYLMLCRRQKWGMVMYLMIFYRSIGTNVFFGRNSIVLLVQKQGRPNQITITPTFMSVCCGWTLLLMLSSSSMIWSKMSSPPTNAAAARRGGGDSATMTATSAKDAESDSWCEKNDDNCSVATEDNIAEIKELQRALGYLISDKCRSNSSEEKVGAEDETLCLIPNLVNRVLVEHYSARPLRQSPNRQDINYSTREKMTQLLIAVIVEFAEPYFVHIARRREEERKKLLPEKQQQKPQKEKKDKKRKGGMEEVKTSSEFGFDDRAVSWATECLKLLLNPSLTASKHSSKGEDDVIDDDLYIPELDGLLASLQPTNTPPSYSSSLEQRMQQALLLGVYGRSLFLSSCIAD